MGLLSKQPFWEVRFWKDEYIDILKKFDVDYKDEYLFDFDLLVS